MVPPTMAGLASQPGEMFPANTVHPGIKLEGVSLVIDLAHKVAA